MKFLVLQVFINYCHLELNGNFARTCIFFSVNCAILPNIIGGFLILIIASLLLTGHLFLILQIHEKSGIVLD